MDKKESIYQENLEAVARTVYEANRAFNLIILGGYLPIWYELPVATKETFKLIVNHVALSMEDPKHAEQVENTVKLATEEFLKGASVAGYAEVSVEIYRSIISVTETVVKSIENLRGLVKKHIEEPQTQPQSKVGAN